MKSNYQVAEKVNSEEMKYSQFLLRIVICIALEQSHTNLYNNMFNMLIISSVCVKYKKEMSQ